MSELQLMYWETLLSVGDSITIGSRSYLGYPEYCGHTLVKHTGKSWNVVNEAVSGETAIELARRLTDKTLQLQAHSTRIATMLIGTNDLKFETPEREFAVAYEQALLKLRLIVKTKNILVIKIPYLVDGVALPYRISMNEQARAFNRIIADLTDQYGLMPFEFDSTSEDFTDGVHLTNDGSQRWGNQLAEYILSLRTSNASE